MTLETLIIGAGPAGLACAMELARAGRTCTILERDEQVGGLAKTLTIREGDDVFLTDIGPHRFFSKNQYLYSFIEDLLHEEWRKVPRLTRQFIDGKFYDYPVNAFQVFKNIGLWRSMRFGFDYVWALLRYRMLGRRIDNFEDYVVANFGRSLANFSMINYTEKIWGIPASTIHPDWATQRIRGLNLLSVLKNALFFKKGADGPKSLVDEFFYPQFGTGRIYEAITKRLKEVNADLHTSTAPTRILHDGKRVTSVEVTIDGEARVLRPDNVVESIPLTEMLGLLDPPPPPEVIEAASKLQWRAQVYLFLTLDKDSISQDNWIYFPNLDIPFGRVAEMKNFSKDMCPEGKTSLFVEFFCFEGDKVWNSSKEGIEDMVIPFFERQGFFKRSEVRQTYLWKRRHVYPVYDLQYLDRLDVIKKWLDKPENLYYVRRPGRFRYTNQDHSLEMGIIAARSLLEGRAYDFDAIGAENEYFESGRIYEKRV